MKAEPIVLAFCVSDSFVCHTAVVIASVLASNPGERFVFHVLCGDLSPGNRKRLAAMETAAASIVCHDIVQKEEQDLPTLLEHVSREAYFRFRIPEVIDAPRVLYSDVDVLVRGPLRPLWETDLRGRPLGAVREASDLAATPSPGWVRYRQTIGLHDGNPYFCSGLLLMDCGRLRAEDATRRLFSYLHPNKTSRR